MDGMSDANLAYLTSERPGTVADDLKGLVAAYFRHAWAFLYVFVFVCVCGAAWIAFATPIYSATATVAIDQRTEDVVDTHAVLSGLPADSAAVDTEVKVIQSRSLLRAVVAKLGLQNDPELNTPAPLHLAQRLARSIANLWSGVMGLFQPAVHPAASRLSKPAAGRSTNMSVQDRIVDHLLGQLDVDREGLTFAIDITYSDANPVKAAQIANAIASEYLEQQREAKAQASERASDWLQTHVQQLRGQVEAADAAVEAYRSKAGLLIANGSTISESQVTDVSGQLATAKAQLADAQARLNSFRSQMKSGSAVTDDAQVSGVLEQLRLKYSDLMRQKDQLAATLGPLHPQMVEINHQIANISGQIGTEEQRVTAALQSNVSAAREKVASLASSQNQAQGELAKEGQAQVRLAELQRNADALRTLYESFLSRYKQIDEQRSLVASDARILSEATPPLMPSFPNKKLMFAISLVIAFVVASTLVFILEFLRGAIIFPEDLERRTQVPALGLVPTLRRRDLYTQGRRIDPMDLVARKPMSVFTEAFRTLRVTIFTSGVGHGGQVIQMTSGTIGEGKTLCAMAFGRTLAMQGVKVLIVDGDLRRRVLSQNLRQPPRYGLVELMSGEADLSDVIIRGGQGSPAVLPISAGNLPPLDLFSADRFGVLLESLRDSFDVIIIDSPPVLAVADALVIARLSDVVVLIAKWGKTPRQAVMKALNQLQKVGANVAGILLTHVDLKTVTAYSLGQGGHSAMMKYYAD